jgi:hypothetical protein
VFRVSGEGGEVPKRVARLGLSMCPKQIGGSALLAAVVETGASIGPTPALRSPHSGERADGRWVARMLLVIALLENDGVLVVDVFDRLEVREAAAEIGLFFTRSSTPRSLPSRASVRYCALDSSSQPRFGD